MTSLDTLLAPGSTQYHIKYPYAINNQGQIAAAVGGPGFGTRAALLTPVPLRPGDTNCDWLVNVNDLLNVINAWGPYSPAPPPPKGGGYSGGGGSGGPGTPDLNSDGNVNVNDLLMVINNWG